ncbi:Cyclic nucleotide-binding domain-containing protein [Psidium guajava]|nr:Cyclic nucleotide-binding domain-containing protein [Psidium guajava]
MTSASTVGAKASLDQFKTNNDEDDLKFRSQSRSCMDSDMYRPPNLTCPEKWDSGNKQIGGKNDRRGTD